jgi:1-acyl-sn-glycerol-3-phosphate acyltransferase
VIRTVLAVLRTIVAVPIIVLDLIFVGGLAGVIAWRNPTSPHVDRCVRLWSRVFLLGTFTRLRYDGRENIDPNRSYVFVANHLSNLDIPVNFLVTAPIGIRYLAKKELFRVPVLGSIMRSIGIVRTDRQAGAEGHHAINRQIDRLRELGLSLMIYPEGTRARDRTVHPFKRGAFRIAVDNQLDIIPVTITGTWDIWRPDRMLIYGGVARARVHEPIPVAGKTRDDIADLQERAYTTIAKGIEELEAIG